MLNSTQLDAIRAKDHLRSRLVEFIASQAFLRNEDLAQACRRLWEAENGLVGPLWVEPVFSCCRSSDTLDSFRREGVLHPDCYEQIKSSGVFPTARQLYTHQAEALRLSDRSIDGCRPALVITAGTGAGKTEAFLLALLNDLYAHPRVDGHDGVRAILVYPMNALVNDQVARIRKWLGDQQRIRFCYYTGETPEDERDTSKLGIDPHKRSAELWTRKQARSSPPDILITNYSMLEYLLCRPQDASLFGGGLRTIVLDEAHVYSGTLAAEIALLLRRVQLRGNVEQSDVLHIASSATLEGDIAKFASDLFWKLPSQIYLIKGEQERQEFGAEYPPRNPLRAEYVQLGDLEFLELLRGDQLEQVGSQEALRSLRPLVDIERVTDLEAESDRARVLWKGLRHAPVVHKLAQYLWERRSDIVLPLSDICEHLWNSTEQEELQSTCRLLQLCARARNSGLELPLVPHKLHL